MTNTPEAEEFQAKLQRLESLVREAEQLPDRAARALARQLVQSLLDLHAMGLERLLDRVAEAGEVGQAIIDTCAADDVIGGLLLLHDLHPQPVEDRVAAALEMVRARLGAHGGRVELLGVNTGVARLRLDCGGGCPSTAAGVRQAIEEAILAKAPDVVVEFVEAATDGRARVSLPLV